MTENEQGRAPRAEAGEPERAGPNRETAGAAPSQRADTALVTQLLHDDAATAIPGAAPALHQTSLFTFESFRQMLATVAGDSDDYIYSRGRNPTVRAFEEKLALLEGAEDACAFASGMGAIAAAILANVSAGQRVVCVRNVYPDAYRLMTELLPRFGVSAEFVDGSNTEAVISRLGDDVGLLYLENPTTLLFELQDVPALTAAAGELGITTVVDNSWATPLGQRPLAQGADLVVHSASKYLSGHSDVVAGVVAGSKQAIDRLRQAELMLLGGKLSPFDAWLLLRGLRTLPLRLQRHHDSAVRIARFLQQQPQVTRVHYPGTDRHPQADLLRRDFRGAGGLLSFELADESMVEPFVDSLRLFRLGVSWGGFESLVYPVLLSHLAGGANSAARAFAVPRSLVRLHVGLEDSDDLTADLNRAFAALRPAEKTGEKTMEV